MSRKIDIDFKDLNYFRGVGEDPSYREPSLIDRDRFWPLRKWGNAPRDLGYDEFPSYHWRGIRLLKDPITQSAYHNMLCEIMPRTIIETGVYSGGSLVWYRDLMRLMGVDCQVIGIDKDLTRCRIPETELENITLFEADCNDLQSIATAINNVRHPIIMIEDAHWNTFNVMKWAVNHLLEENDYFVIEDMMPFWERYSPKTLAEYLSHFDDYLAMDMVYSNSCPQLERGVFKRI